MEIMKVKMMRIMVMVIYRCLTVQNRVFTVYSKSKLTSGQMWLHIWVLTLKGQEASIDA